MIDLFSSFDECVKQYEKLCHKISHKYKNLEGYEYNDKFNVALYGLYKAYLNYDKTKGASFLTFANNMIHQEFNLIYRDQNAKKRQHEPHLDLNKPTEEGNASFSETIEDKNANIKCKTDEIYYFIDRLENEYEWGWIFKDYINGISVSDIELKVPYARRWVYKQIEICREKLLKMLEREGIYYGM